jgi:putative tryptophan/tyrosine transport system substrate-binding protein
VRRREFIMLLGGAAAAWPVAASAQQPTGMRRIGVLNPFAENIQEEDNLKAFRQALQKLGWNDGRSVRIDYRWSGADPARIRVHAKELVGLNPDVIVVSTALALQPLQQETRSIPIVFTRVVDPVEAGFVASLARPGGNITGFTPAEYSVFGKLLDVFKELAPRITRVAVIFNPDQAPQAGILRALETAAPSVMMQVTPAPARDVVDLERIIDEFAREPNSGLVVLPNPVTDASRKLIIAMVSRRGVPAAYGYRHFVADGGLISYGVDLAEQYRLAAGYVDRILRGEKPGDLPVQAPTKYETVINLKTARALGLTVPDTLLARADDVIE